MGEHSAETNSQRPDLLSPYLYCARNLIERFFNKIKQCRRAAARVDKRAANYLAFVKLVSIRIWLRANESASWSGNGLFALLDAGHPKKPLAAKLLIYLWYGN